VVSHEVRAAVVHHDVRAAWTRVTETWVDALRHDAFFALVVQHQCFAWAAARYKERGADPIATEQLARLRKAAMATMMAAAAARPQKERQPYRNVMVTLIVLLVAMLLGLVVTKSIHDNTPVKPTKQAPR
jgi:hypothetical protein